MYFLAPVSPQSPRVESPYATSVMSPVPPRLPSDAQSAVSGGGINPGAIPVQYYMPPPPQHPQQQATPVRYEPYWMDPQRTTPSVLSQQPQQLQQQSSSSFYHLSGPTTPGEVPPTLPLPSDLMMQHQRQCVWISADGTGVTPLTPAMNVLVSPSSGGATPSPSNSSAFYAAATASSASFNASVSVATEEEGAGTRRPSFQAAPVSILIPANNQHPFIVNPQMMPAAFPAMPFGGAFTVMAPVRAGAPAEVRPNSSLYELQGRYIGRVKRYNRVRGYGFLSATHRIISRPRQPEPGQPERAEGAVVPPEEMVEEHVAVDIGDIFVHHYYIMPPATELLVGACVTFTVGPYHDEQHAHRYQAVTVEVQAPRGQLRTMPTQDSAKTGESALASTLPSFLTNMQDEAPGPATEIITNEPENSAHSVAVEETVS